MSQSLSTRLEIVRRVDARLDQLVVALDDEATTRWRALSRGASPEWRTLVTQYVLPLLEPLRLDGYMRVEQAMRAQMGWLMVERLLDDVHDEHADPQPLVAAVALAVADSIAAGAEVTDRVAAILAAGRPENLDPTEPNAARRAPALMVIPESLLSGDSLRRWRPAFDALLSLSFLLDDVADAVADLGAGRRTWVVGQLVESGWTPGRVDISIRIAREIEGRQNTLAAHLLAVDDRFPLLTATAAAMSPSSMRAARESRNPRGPGSAEANRGAVAGTRPTYAPPLDQPR